jgi:hypothetical protein
MEKRQNSRGEIWESIEIGGEGDPDEGWVGIRRCGIRGQEDLKGEKRTVSLAEWGSWQAMPVESTPEMKQEKRRDQHGRVWTPADQTQMRGEHGIKLMGEKGELWVATQRTWDEMIVVEEKPETHQQERQRRIEERNAFWSRSEELKNLRQEEEKERELGNVDSADAIAEMIREYTPAENPTEETTPITMEAQIRRGIEQKAKNSGDALEIAKRLVLDDKHAFHDWIEKNVQVNKDRSYSAGIALAQGRYSELSFMDRANAQYRLLEYASTSAKNQAEKVSPIIMGDEKLELDALRLHHRHAVEEIKEISDKMDRLKARIASSNPEIPVKRDSLLFLISYAQAGIRELEDGDADELLKTVEDIKKLTEI